MQQPTTQPTDFDLDLPVDQENIRNELRLRDQGIWVSIDLSSSSRPPRFHQKIWFRNHWVYLIPIEGNRSAYFATKLLENETVEIVVKILYAFLSGLSWSNDLSLSYTYSSSGDMPKSHSFNEAKISHTFDIIDREDIPDPLDPKARRALAFYREGLSIDHPYYSFLSFYKIINSLHSNGPAQEAWINNQLPKLNELAQQRLKKISENNSDIGKYMHVNGRCAVAHAWSEPIADPDNPADLKRLNQDKIIIQELAKLVIQENFNVKSREDLIKNNEHRIKKLLNIFDAEVLNSLLNEGNIKKPLSVSIPYITIGIKGKKPYKTLQKLYFDQIEIFEDKKMRLFNITEDRRAGIQILIDLEKNDLSFDLNNPIIKFSDHNDLTNAEIELDNITLFKDYFLNGSIRIYCPKGNLLANSEYFIPENMFIDNSGISKIDKQINQLQQRIEDFKNNKI